MIADALQQATRVPLRVAERAVEVQQIANSLRTITNPKMSSDLTTAVALAKAALEGALANVEINLESIALDAPEDQTFVSETQKRLAALKTQA
jgi:glutamate formiminotransferase/formiminotetrahydrofolate cyclodeaminase